LPLSGVVPNVSEDHVVCNGVAEQRLTLKGNPERFRSHGSGVRVSRIELRQGDWRSSTQACRLRLEPPSTLRALRISGRCRRWAETI